jgi:hypothetical protein
MAVLTASDKINVIGGDAKVYLQNRQEAFRKKWAEGQKV